MVRYAWPGWWLGLLMGIGAPAAAQQAADPPAVELKENYPNPFYASTTIPFTIHPEVCRDGYRPLVTLEVRNVIAQIVAIPLLTEDQPRRVQRLRLPCGEYRATWDGTFLDGERQATTGVYWYRLTVDRHRQTRKMIVQEKVTSSSQGSM